MIKHLIEKLGDRRIGSAVFAGIAMLGILVAVLAMQRKDEDTKDNEP